MKTQERVEVLSVPQDRPNPVVLVLLVTLGSFAVGLIPFVYSSSFADTQFQNSAIAGESALWSVFGEKQDLAK